MSRHGMLPGVQRALGITTRRGEPEAVVCGCGTAKVFDTNPIGQLVERCPRCRTARVYRAVRRFSYDDSNLDGQ